MTHKARKILNDLKRRDQKAKLWRLFRTPEARDQALQQFNQSTLDPVGPIEEDHGMKVLSEMNELGEAQEQAIRASFPKITFG